MATDYQETINSLNEGQQSCFEIVKSACDHSQAQAFFIDGPAGTGKTYLYSLLLSMAHRQGDVALAVASSGIAALLLQGVRTTHSRFKIPIPIHALSTCNISIPENLAMLINRTKMVVWDEAPMMHQHNFEAADWTLRDLMGMPDILFGGLLW